MSTSQVEERFEILETEILELRKEVSALKAKAENKFGWRRAVGIGEDCELGRDALQLGREWRESENL